MPFTVTESPETPAPCRPTTDTWTEDLVTASASAFGPSSRLKTTAPAGGAGKLGRGEAGGAAAASTAGADDTGPGVSCRRSAASATAETPAARARSAAVSLTATL